MKTDPVVIVSAARTPMGAFQGELKSFAAPELGAAAIRAAVERAKLKPEDVQEVLMGCVLPAGQGQAPARQAALGAGLPLSTGCTTVNKMCGSGMKAAMLAHDSLLSRLRRHRRGRRHGIHDQRALPAAEGARRPAHGPRPGDRPHVLRRPGGRLREGPADGHVRRGVRRRASSFTREAQDDFAITSLKRAQKANKDGSFAWEITPLAIKAGKEQKFVEMDEQPFKANLEKIPTLKPAFRKDGTVTAANSSLDLRRRRGAGADAPLDGGAARPRAARDDHRPFDARAGAGLVHDGAGRRDQEIA